MNNMVAPSPFLWEPGGVFGGRQPYPHDVFAFLDVDHPAVTWAVQRGALVSSRFMSEEPTVGFTSMMMAGMIMGQNRKRLANELTIEAVRQQRHAGRVSRLTGMYFFGSEEDARRRIGDPDWPDYFRASCLVRMRLWTVVRPTVVDANWITHAPRTNDGRLDPAQLSWIDRYWSGEVRGPDAVWEVIADGVAVILDEELRRLCYDEARTQFPRAEIPILMSRLAGEAGTLGGVIGPFLRRLDGDRIRLDFIQRDAEFHEPNVIEEMRKHPDAGYLGRLMAENETWRAPDFRPWGAVLDLVEEAQTAQVERATIHQR